MPEVCGPGAISGHPEAIRGAAGLLEANSRLNADIASDIRSAPRRCSVQSRTLIDNGLLMDLDPYTSVGAVRFGMKPEDVEVALSAAPEPVCKAGVRVDRFDEQSVHVHYSEEETVEYVETLPPSGLRIADLALTPGTETGTLLNTLETRGYALTRHAPDLVLVRDLGVSVWCPGEQAETIRAFGSSDLYSERWMEA